MCAGQSGVSDLLMHPRNGMFMEALYAVPSHQMDVMWLVRQPLVLSGFHAALKGLLGTRPRLAGFEIFARLCHTDLKGPKEELVHLAMRTMAAGSCIVIRRKVIVYLICCATRCSK